ncbi:MAG: hypothetical protein V1788_02225 [Nanoarchaeota archaeon]
MDFLNRFILTVLGFDSLEIERWISRKNVLSDRRYGELKEEWNNLKKRINVLKISKKNPRKSLRDLKLMGKNLKKLKKEIDKGEIIFKNFKEFKRFTWWFEFIYLGTGVPFKNISHEKQHAKVFWENNIRCEFGWKKLNSKKKGYYFIPFVQATAPDRLMRKSINSAEELSPGDKEDLRIFTKLKC